MKVSELKKMLENIEEGEITVDGKTLDDYFTKTERVSKSLVKNINIDFHTLSGSMHDR